MGLLGIEGYLVSVEAHISPGLPSITLVGLPDTSLREAKERVRAAVSSSGFQLGSQRLTINLSPASMPKTGSSFDLAIAIAMLFAEQRWGNRLLESVCFISELGLDGSLRGIRGVLASVMSAAQQGIKTVVVADENKAEASLVPKIKVLSYSHLTEVINDFGGKCRKIKLSPPQLTPCRNENISLPQRGEMLDVKGQENAKYALEVAAAGGHHMMMMGVPGAGKTMLARCLPSILPPLTRAEALESTALASLAGKTLPPNGLLQERPFESPHHAISLPAMVGGGSGIPQPGAVSIAHNGVLFLDEAPEFSPGVLDSLRQPLEEGKVRISRVKATVEMPASFQLLLAANPCPCGNSLSRLSTCVCTPWARRRYFQRLSGPLRDRIDIQLLIEIPTRIELMKTSAGDSSSIVRERVCQARERAEKRLKDFGLKSNSQLSGRQIRQIGKFSQSALEIGEQAFEKGRVSLRGRDRILRLARTIADLEGRDNVQKEDVFRALGLRDNGGSDGGL
ncbi:YifB family Mg chelatase-like AAA ATPase [Actinomycetaceae bacterium TAE3-ERU4]|nr:YifB family Mg chelatase-like AAA ATPase [Actinomycetaceae bacterium TAE3-ERU4]